MTKSQIKHEAGAPEQGWDVLIRDAEAEIVVCEGRIDRLRRVIRAAHIQIEAGVPFPDPEVLGQEGD